VCTYKIETWSSWANIKENVSHPYHFLACGGIWSLSLGYHVRLFQKVDLYRHLMRSISQNPASHSVLVERFVSVYGCELTLSFCRFATLLYSLSGLNLKFVLGVRQVLYLTTPVVAKLNFWRCCVTHEVYVMDAPYLAWPKIILGVLPTSQCHWELKKVLQALNLLEISVHQLSGRASGQPYVIRPIPL
jgi:hypothetical protein